MISFIICALLIIAIVGILVFGVLLNDAFNQLQEDEDNEFDAE